MQTIVQKLPLYLQDKWREKVVSLRTVYKTIANFGNLTDFVQIAAESANDPVYSRKALSKTDAVVKSTGKSGTNPRKSQYGTNKQSNISAGAIGVNNNQLNTASKGRGTSSDGAGRQSLQSNLTCILCKTFALLHRPNIV